MRRIGVCLGVVAVLVVGAAQFHVAGQERPREDALLAEVRGLRLATEQLAAVNARVQLATSRLQLQEQRISALIARHAQQRDRIPPVEREVAELERRVTELRSFLERPDSPLHRENLEYELRKVRVHLAQQTTELRRLQGEEAEVANLISTEQARWAELNRQLEQLDAAFRK